MEASAVELMVQNEARFPELTDEKRGKCDRGKEGSVAYGTAARVPEGWGEVTMFARRVSFVGAGTVSPEPLASGRVVFALIYYRLSKPFYFVKKYRGF